jgi:hypothetical protein
MGLVCMGKPIHNDGGTLGEFLISAVCGPFLYAAVRAGVSKWEVHNFKQLLPQAK